MSDAAAQLRVTLVQEAAGLDPEQNRATLARLVPDLADQTDLVVFPEAFARDFGPPGSDVAEFAEGPDGPFVAAVEEAATTHGTTILAGMFARGEDPERPSNRLVLRGAARADYDKVHLYDSFGYRESDRLTAGAWEPCVVPLGGLTLGLMTCYDLRFPELARALVAAGADVLVVPAAWVAGERKVDHWRTLLRARAIENTAYVVGVGQPGPRYSGHSMVVTPMGDVAVEAGTDPLVLHTVLGADVIADARAVNPSLANRRR